MDFTGLGSRQAALAAIAGDVGEGEAGGCSLCRLKHLHVVRAGHPSAYSCYVYAGHR